MFEIKILLASADITELPLLVIISIQLLNSNVEQSDLIATGVSAAKRHTNSNSDLLYTNLSLLNKLVAESNANGVKVVLFTPPARKSYISNLDLNQLSIMKLKIIEITQKNTNVEYYDFMNDSRFIDNDFKDADHLNGIGAKKLTQFIDHIIFDEVKIAYPKNTPAM